jgi:hypothetical protein
VNLSVLAAYHLVAGAVVLGRAARGGELNGLFAAAGGGVLGAGALYGALGSAFWILGARGMEVHRPSDYPFQRLVASGQRRRFAGFILTAAGAAAMVFRSAPRPPEAWAQGCS